MLNFARQKTQHYQAEYNEAVQLEITARGIRDRGLHADNLARQYDNARDEMYAARDALHAAQREERDAERAVQVARNNYMRAQANEQSRRWKNEIERKKKI